MSYLQAQEEFIGRIRLAPNRVWISNYLDLVRQLIIGLDIREHDPRLAITIPLKTYDKPYIPVSINYRYVLAPDNENGELVISFVLGKKYDSLSKEIQEKVKDKGDFKPHRNLIEPNPPGWFSTNLGFFMQSNILRVAWLQECINQLAAAKSSAYRKSHEPIIYDAALFLDYRAMILDKAFKES